MPNRRPSSAKLPTASSDDSTPLTSQLEADDRQQAQVVRTTGQEERQVRGDHGDRDFGASDEVGDHALLAPDGQAADHRADQADDANFEAAAGDPGQQDRQHDADGQRELGVDEDGEQHADRGQREDVRPQRAARR